LTRAYGKGVLEAEGFAVAVIVVASVTLHRIFRRYDWL
jgi:hypothetical protein